MAELKLFWKRLYAEVRCCFLVRCIGSLVTDAHFQMPLTAVFRKEVCIKVALWLQDFHPINDMRGLPPRKYCFLIVLKIANP